VIGAGARGRSTYGAWCGAHPELARVVAVAEPNDARRAAMAADHDLPPDAAHADWRALLADSGIAADALVIATPDRQHTAPAVAALDAGWDVVLEKPIAPTLDGVREVAAAASRSRGTVTVAHVLRYTPFFGAVKRAIDDGWIGDVVTIEHRERVGYWHFGHSFVRGNWRREDHASPMILAKACHDLDLLRWLAGERCTAVSSFGGLRHFRPEAAPPGALHRCITPGGRRCPAAPGCPWDAVRLYVERTAATHGWPVSVITDDPSPAGRLDALKHGPYGRCVYASDNDVADHQVVALEFENDVRAILSVAGPTADNTREVLVTGTRGELRGRLDTGRIEVRRYLPAAVSTPGDGPWDRDELGRAAMRDDERIELETGSAAAEDGHGGGDDAMLRDVVARLVARRDGIAPDDDAALTSLAASIDSHLMAFAAELSRREGRTIALRADAIT
jgi:predicted dehydrogenase